MKNYTKEDLEDMPPEGRHLIKKIKEMHKREQENPITELQRRAAIYARRQSEEYFKSLGY